MNKKRVNDWLIPAKKAIVECGISSDGKTVNKTFRGQISAFGAAVVMGSLKSAIAFYADQGGASVDRTRLLYAIYYLVTGKKTKRAEEVFDYVCENDTPQTKEMFTDASIAIKLALNFYSLIEEDGNKSERDDA